MTMFSPGDLVEIINLDHADACDFPAYMGVDPEDAIGMTSVIRTDGFLLDGYVCIFNKEGEDDFLWWFDAKCLKKCEQFLCRTGTSTKERGHM